MAFGKLKQNFSVGRWVRVGKTTSVDLDGLIGRVAGKSYSDNVMDAYIIVMAQPVPNDPFGYVAIQITEACLEPVEGASTAVLGLAALRKSMGLIDGPV
jgi:hypothetical protein